jgi:hypothetical protein
MREVEGDVRAAELENRDARDVLGALDDRVGLAPGAIPASMSTLFVAV